MPLTLKKGLLAAAIAIAGGSALADASVSYEPEKVQLEGYISTRLYPGPPDYSEGDKKISVPVIKLNKPVNVIPGKQIADNDPDSQPEKNVNEMQIVSYRTAVKLKGCYRLSGTLMHQAAAGHYTPVLIVMDAWRKSDSCKE